MTTKFKWETVTVGTRTGNKLNLISWFMAGMAWCGVQMRS